MTVRELIEALQAIPEDQKDLPVVFWEPYDGDYYFYQDDPGRPADHHNLAQFEIEENVRVFSGGEEAFLPKAVVF